MSLEEAIAIAHKHRDQLLRGVERLRLVPPGGSDADYRQLQEDLDREAPDVSNLSWGHKYFSLLFPEKLDDYHNADHQRFHLRKLLLQPPEGKGRYDCGGRYVAIATELGMPMNSLTTVLNRLDGEPRPYWRIGTSNGEFPRNRWDLMRAGGLVAIGWDQLGDLSELAAAEGFQEQLKRRLAERYPTAPAATGRAASQIARFLEKIAVGDLVVAADGATVLGIGRVTGDYQFDGSSDFAHRRAIRWLSTDEWKLPEPEGLLTTLSTIGQTVNILEIERRILHAGPDPGPGPDLPPKRRIGVPGRIQSILERKGQCILYGPPGTGKTYWAERTARDLAALAAFGRLYEKLDATQQAEVHGGDRGDGLVRLCCFHPGYGYKDFLEGYRPEVVGGQVGFRLRDGGFKRLCRDASANPGRRYVLIIDEINRGDIPRIFGELLTVLEADKRGKAITLPVSGETLRVPPNVFLIATMNTADRSISLLDAALRRRFGFVELMPDASVLRGHTVHGVPLAAWLEALNRRVCEHVGRDARHLQIGHSYLLHDGRPIATLDALRHAVRDDIVPLLEEYCYEDFTALQAILGNGLLDTANRRIRHEVFEPGRDAALIQALLEPCPEVIASPEAIAADASESVADAPDAEDPN